MPDFWRKDAWISRLERLYTPVVADILDKCGYRFQTMRADIRPLFPEAKIAGYARTAQVMPAREIAPPRPYSGELEVVDSLQMNDVLVVSRGEWSFWGELLSTAAKYRGCRGILIDGFTRDSRAIERMGFPVFCRGIHPADSLGRLDVTAHGLPIECGGVWVDPGDLILADYDGVVVIPRTVAEKALDLAEEKVSGENTVRQALQEGMTTRAAFEKFGIL